MTIKCLNVNKCTLQVALSHINASLDKTTETWNVSNLNCVLLRFGYLFKRRFLSWNWADGEQQLRGSCCVMYPSCAEWDGFEFGNLWFIYSERVRAKGRENGLLPDLPSRLKTHTLTDTKLDFIWLLKNKGDTFAVKVSLRPPWLSANTSYTITLTVSATWLKSRHLVDSLEVKNDRINSSLTVVLLVENCSFYCHSDYVNELAALLSGRCTVQMPVPILVLQDNRGDICSIHIWQQRGLSQRPKERHKSTRLTKQTTDRDDSSWERTVWLKTLRRNTIRPWIL